MLVVEICLLCPYSAHLVLSMDHRYEVQGSQIWRPWSLLKLAWLIHASPLWNQVGQFLPSWSSLLTNGPLICSWVISIKWGFISASWSLLNALCSIQGSSRWNLRVGFHRLYPQLKHFVLFGGYLFQIGGSHSWSPSLCMSHIYEIRSIGLYHVCPYLGYIALIINPIYEMQGSNLALSVLI